MFLNAHAFFQKNIHPEIILSQSVPRPRRCLAAHAVSLALASLAVPGAHAAEPAPQPEAPPADTAQVIVTAQSRSQQIQSVPIAVTAMSGQQLKDQGAANLSDIDSFVPGLSIDTSQPTRPNIFLRGVGTLDFGIGTDSPVGIYTDGVYTGKTGGSLLNFNDIKRIEVLKGPQGTLFGRNAAAGAISIVSNDPVGRVEGSGLVRLGENGLRHEELMYNTPLTDNLAFRISAVDQGSHGWTRNAFDGSRAGGDRDSGGRAALRWQDDNTSAVLSWEHEKMRGPGPATYSVTGGKVNFGGPDVWTAPLNIPLSNDAATNRQSRTFDGVTLRVERTLPFATLTSTTAYRHFNTQNWQDMDGTSNPAAYLAIGNVESNSTWQQEFKLNGQSGPLDWVAGASAFRERATQRQEVNVTTTSLDTLFQHAAGLSPYATLTQLAQGIGKATGNTALQGMKLTGLPWQESINDVGGYRAFAIYGDVIWHAANDTNLTLGGRYTADHKAFNWYNPARTASALDAQLATLNQAQFFPTATALKLLTAQQSGLLQKLVQSNVQFNNPGSTSAPYAVSKSWSNFSPRVLLDKHLGADHMVYASWSKGYQAGGFDAVGVNGHYEEELVTSMELGAKGEWRAAGLTYGAALFHYDFTNLQSLTLVPNSAATGIPSYQVANSDQGATGLDLDVQWKINRTWRLTGSLEYIDQTYDNYVSPTGVNISGQAAGTPYFSAALGAAAKWQALDGNADFSVQYGYMGKRRCNDDTYKQGLCRPDSAVGAGKAQERVDLRLGWTAPSGRWGVGLVANNLMDKQYVNVSTLGEAVGSPYVYVTRPRSLALELRVKL